MRIVTAMDMRKRLGQILDAVAAGERIRIERDHKAMAYLVPVQDGQRLTAVSDELRERRLRALDEIAEFAQRMRQKYPDSGAAVDAATAVRMDRDRDEPTGHR
jgi:antitoxin (DNA-binding transcriptional repressor) of toxin-antitoxin stability system